MFDVERCVVEVGCVVEVESPSKAISGGGDRRQSQNFRKGAKSENVEPHWSVNEVKGYVTTTYVLAVVVNMVCADIMYSYSADSTNAGKSPGKALEYC